MEVVGLGGALPLVVMTLDPAAAAVVVVGVAVVVVGVAVVVVVVVVVPNRLIIAA